MIKPSQDSSKNPTDILITSIASNSATENTSLFQQMLIHPSHYSKKVFQAGMGYLSQQEPCDTTLLNELTACYDNKIQQAKAARATRNSFCAAPASIFTCLGKTADQASTLHSSKTHLLPLSSIPEEYNETDHTNDPLYPTSDHDTMYLVMVNMSENPTQYQSYQLQQAIDDLNALPHSPRDSSTLRDRISLISTQRATPFTTDIIETLKQALITGLSITRDTIDDPLTTNSPS
ncbi:MAG: hypothetical protein CMF55_04540 [Legionellales bacterium]|nr:hypothetical protein [Legionellales bacterium]